MDWNSFFTGLLGTILPMLIVSIIMWKLNQKTNKALETHRTELSRKLTFLEKELGKRAEMFSVWHQKRVNALVEIYQAFREYLNFVRRQLYIPSHTESMDPYFKFRDTLDENLVYLNDELQQQIQQYSGELLLFWNWAVIQEREGNVSAEDEVQRRLDYEIPTYLEKLRKVINDYAEPENYSDEKTESENNEV